MLLDPALFNLRRYILMLLESLVKNCVISFLSPLKKPSLIFFYLSPKETLFRSINLPPPTLKSRKLCLYIYSHVISVGSLSMISLHDLKSNLRKLCLCIYMYTHVISVGSLSMINLHDLKPKLGKLCQYIYSCY